mgnify:CR=1 FL=1
MDAERASTDPSTRTVPGKMTHLGNIPGLTTSQGFFLVAELVAVTRQHLRMTRRMANMLFRKETSAGQLCVSCFAKHVLCQKYSSKAHHTKPPPPQHPHNRRPLCRRWWRRDTSFRVGGYGSMDELSVKVQPQEAWDAGVWGWHPKLARRCVIL